MGNYGDFTEEQNEEKANSSSGTSGTSSVGGEQANAETQGFVRARMPRGKELIGAIAQRFGGNKMEVLCSDGKTRNCRVPGRYKRALWLRPRDIVLVVPWEFDSSKADVIFKYSSSAINQLRRNGLLNFIGNSF